MRGFKLVLSALLISSALYISGCSSKQSRVTIPEEGEEVASMPIEEKKRVLYYYKLGVANLENGSMQEALSYLIKAYKLDPNNFQILNALGIAYARVGEYAKAEKMLKKALQINPNSGQVYTNLGVLYALQKRFDEAIKYLEKAVSIDEYRNKYKALFNLALIYLKIGNPAKYEEYMKRAIAYEPYKPDAYVSLGEYYLKNKRYLNAYDIYLTALTNGLETPEILAGLGKTHYYLRNYDKAQYYLQKALKLSANNPVLKQEIETFLAKIERKKRYSETDEFSKTNIINENFFIEKPQIDEKKKKEIITKAFQDLDENVQEDEVIDLIKYQPPKKRIQTYSSRKKKTYRTDKKKYAKITEPRIKRRSEETIRETKRKTSQTTRRKKLITYRYKPEKKVIKPKLSYKYFLQIGLFSNYSNALRVKRMVSALGEDAKIIKERIGNDTYYRVIIGYFDTSSEAIRKKRELRRKNPQIQAVIKYKKEGN